MTWRTWLGIGLIAAVGLGLYQSGYTGAEWQAIKETAHASQRTPVQEVRQHDGWWGLARLVWQTSSDERLYQEYARLTLEGTADLEYIRDKQYADWPIPEGSRRLWPYRDVPVEYPAVSLLAMVVPGLVSLDPWGYRFALGVMNLLLLGLCVWLGSRLVPGVFSVRQSTWRVLFLLLLLGIVVVTRIDLVATALLLAAMLACERHRPALGGLLTALGFMAKVFPGLWALGFVLIALRQRRYRQLAWFLLTLAATLGACLAAMWFVAGDAVFDTFLYHGARGIQIESSWASVVLPLHLLLDLGVSLQLSHGSSNLVTPLDDLARNGWLVAFAILALPFALAAWRKPAGRRPWPLMAGLLLCFMLANKVFSPQYLLWVFPFFSLDGSPGGRRNAWLFLVACALSQVIYPRGYDTLKAFHPAMVGVLVARNALVTWLWGSMLRRVWVGEPSTTPGEPTAKPLENGRLEGHG